MIFTEEISRIVDALTYVQAYAPDFPEEDCTNLVEQSRRIVDRFDAIAPMARGDARQHWLRLARQEIVAGFDSYAADERKAHRHLDDGIEFIRRAKRGKAPQTSFVVGSDGVIHAANVENRESSQ